MTPFWACPTHYSSPIQVRISKFGPQMYFSTVKIPVNSELDWPWTSLSFLIPKIICLNCGGVHWDCETVPGLFQCCSGTVSQSLHQCTWRVHSQCGMGTLLLKLNKIITYTVSQYDCFTVWPCCAMYWSRWPRVISALMPLLSVSILHLATISRVQFQISKCWQCSKLLPVRLPEADNFGGGPGTFFKDFPQFNVYDLRFKAGRLTTFLTEFWTLMLVFIVQWEKSSIISIWGWNFRTTP